MLLSAAVLQSVVCIWCDAEPCFFFVFFCFVLNYTAFRCVRCLKSDERHVLAMLYLFSIFLRFLLQNSLFVSTDIYL